ncbi:unnamed protein product [Strongylus vulgaris]|uniref:Uncharacterized protein n=1 Tax=Strongylus vulgaris TaxID=40348 RepID=A0A3P7J203_STRVU|nr:unnamed protein product [Strongylus vulgaris]
MDKSPKPTVEETVEVTKTSEQTSPETATPEEKLPTPPPSPVEGVEEPFKVKKLTETTDKEAGDSLKVKDVSFFEFLSFLAIFLERGKRAISKKLVHFHTG